MSASSSLSSLSLSPSEARDPLLVEADEAVALIKVCANSKRFIDEYTSCLADKSIGIHYDVTAPVNTCRNKAELKTALNSNYVSTGSSEITSRGQTHKFFDRFVNHLKVGDTVLLGRGITTTLCIATITSDCYFTNESKWNTHTKEHSVTGQTIQLGTYHRRRISNIRILPDNTTAGTKYLATLRLKPSKGWGLETNRVVADKEGDEQQNQMDEHSDENDAIEE